MLLTVPCYPSPCLLICLKTVLPLKRRVSGVFLWLRCVSPSPVLCAHWVLPGAHSRPPRSLHDTLHVPATLLHSVSPASVASPLPEFSSLPLFCCASGESVTRVLSVASGARPGPGRSIVQSWMLPSRGPLGSDLTTPGVLPSELSFPSLSSSLLWCFRGPLLYWK